MTVKLSNTETTEITLMSGKGSTGGFGTSSRVPFVLTHNVTNNLTAISGTTPSGDFNAETDMNAFLNKPANTTWSLKVSDAAGGQTGTVYFWRLSVLF